MDLVASHKSQNNSADMCNDSFIKNTFWTSSWEKLFYPVRTTKAQISLRIRAVWSAPLLFAP